MMLIKKIFELKKINYIGEVVSYLYILSVFINSKLNMKIGYILLGFGIIKLGIYLKSDPPCYNKKIYGIFSAFLLLGLISNIIVSQNNGVSNFLSENSVFFYIFFLGVFINKKEQLEKCNYILGIGTILLCLYGIHYGNDYFIGGSISRQRGLLIVISVYYFIDFLENVFNYNLKIKSILNFIILNFSVYALVRLNSRMAFFSIMLSGIIYILYFIFLKKEKKVYTILITFLLLGGITYNYTPKSYINRLKTSFQTKNNVSNEDRIIMWKAGIEIYKKNPILGVGASPQDVQPLLIEYVDKNVEKEILRNEFIRDKKFSRLHNMYLDFIVQSGILGIGYIILLLVLIPYEFYKSNKKGMKVPLFFSLVSFYVYGITWSLWSDYHIVQVLFNIMLMLMLIDIEIEGKN